MNLHFPIEKNSMLLKTFDKYIMRMVDHGIVEHYENAYFISRGNLIFFDAKLHSMVINLSRLNVFSMEY